MKKFGFKIIGLLFLGLVMGCEGTFDVDPLEIFSITLQAPSNSELCDVRILESGDFSVRFEWSIDGEFAGDYTLNYTNTVTGVTETTIVQGGQRAVDLTLEPGVRYTWNVSTVFNGQTIAPEADFVTVTPGIQGTTHPPYLSDIEVESLGGTDYQLNFSAIDPDQDAIVYDVFLDTQDPPLSQIETNSTNTTVGVTLSSSTTYYVQVIAKDGTGNETTALRTYTTP